MAYIDLLIEQFPIRKTKAQKESFRTWVLEEIARMGYADARVEKKGVSNNVVIGDPETAQAIFTAHYDTPPVMPVPNFITPCNIPVYLVYQIAIAFAMIAVGAGVGALIGWLAGIISGSVETGALIGAPITMIAMWGIIFMLMFGPANKHNANDNTSGVAAVLETMARIPADQRSKAAFILFDNEEKGLLGSSGYAAKHKQVKKNGFLVNMDCVGLGENILFFTPKKTRALDKYALLMDAVNAQQGRAVEWMKLEKCQYPSDQNNYKNGIAVCSCKKARVTGYYCDKIHTRHDTFADAGNIAFLADGMAAFVNKL